ncbi:benzyl alcohol O-benzoyltransferase-like [Magnolia sinica]|uniref:benzyl alcohol O-benzoyltransferase-like n=1 Tax=Magnolia sinica TaxID=86752 RepID=UPI00265AF31E|nr:benzyl alcohol O-benzoyltransferase-like [Magnolia sinica]
MASPPPLLFSVKRHKPTLVAPSNPTPHEFKYLSDIDDQQGFRFQIPVIHFYRYNPSMRARDPAQVIRQAVASALVFYYPLAGRLREEGTGRKLVVECTGEGVLFIEADADVMLEQFGGALHPPFPCMEELLTEVPGSERVLHCPLLLIQVTRLLCGGFIFALRINHAISDATGLNHFLNAVCEMARGAPAPSLLPVWQRHLLSARSPPRVTCVHREYDQVAETIGAFVPHDDVLHRSFFFGPNEISALRKQVPSHLRTCSTVELLTACLWRCRTKAIGLDPDVEVRVLYIVNARNKYRPPLPPGYYGNAIALPAAISPAGKLCKNPLGYAVELVKKAKSSVTDEYMRSVADMMVLKGRPLFTVTHSFLVSDLTHILVGEVDFGWGKAVYKGPARGGVGTDPLVASFYVPLKNTRGEVGIMVPICLPRPAMDIFSAEIENIINGPKQQLNNNSSKLIVSPL